MMQILERSFMLFLIRRVSSVIHKIGGLAVPRAHNCSCGVVSRERTQILDAEYAGQRSCSASA
eukprot:9480411-Pyramimonas_sp.AAC.1